LPTTSCWEIVDFVKDAFYRKNIREMQNSQRALAWVQQAIKQEERVIYRAVYQQTQYAVRKSGMTN